MSDHTQSSSVVLEWCQWDTKTQAYCIKINSVDSCNSPMSRHWGGGPGLFVCVHTRTCTPTNIRTHTHEGTCTHTHTQTHAQTYTHTNIYTYTCTVTHTYTHTHMHRPMYTYTSCTWNYMSSGVCTLKRPFLFFVRTSRGTCTWPYYTWKKKRRRMGWLWLVGSIKS